MEVKKPCNPWLVGVLSAVKAAEKVAPDRALTGPSLTCARKVLYIYHWSGLCVREGQPLQIFSAASVGRSSDRLRTSEHRLLRPPDPRVLPRYLQVLVVAAEADVGTAAIGDLDRLVLSEGNRDGSAQAGAGLFSVEVPYAV